MIRYLLRGYIRNGVRNRVRNGVRIGKINIENLMLLDICVWTWRGEA